MSCYTGFFNVRRGWQSLNTGPRFYLRPIRRTGWLWINTSRTTDGRPFKPKKLSFPFLYPGVPAGLTPFRGLVPLGRRNLVPILPPAHPLWGGGGVQKFTLVRRLLMICVYNWQIQMTNKNKKQKTKNKKNKNKKTRCVISIYFVHIVSFPHGHVVFFLASAFTWVLMWKKKPVISNTARFFCFNSTVSYT